MGGLTVPSPPLLSPSRNLERHLTLAAPRSSLLELGFSPLQGLGIILFSNLIVLLPMVANAHGGTKYGVPFP